MLLYNIQPIYPSVCPSEFHIYIIFYQSLSPVEVVLSDALFY